MSGNRRGVSVNVSTVLDAVGALAIVTGVGLISVPAALITLGAFCLLVSWRLTR